MALGKPVLEDRPWENIENWRGGNAVDGRYTNRSAAGGQCVISANRADTATWRVDLGAWSASVTFTFTTEPIKTTQNTVFKHYMCEHLFDQVVFLKG